MEKTMTRKEAAQTLTKLLAKFEELDKTWGGISDKYYEAVTIACGVLLVDDVLNTNPIPPKETVKYEIEQYE